MVRHRIDHLWTACSCSCNGNDSLPPLLTGALWLALWFVSEFGCAFKRTTVPVEICQGSRTSQVFAGYSTIVQAREVIAWSELVEEKLPHVRWQPHTWCNGIILDRHVFWLYYHNKRTLGENIQVPVGWLRNRKARHHERVGSRLPPEASALGSSYSNHFLLSSSTRPFCSSKILKMSTLSFAFSPEATAKVHDALICLAKFGETVCMEARGDMVCSCYCAIWSFRPANVDPLAYFDYVKLI